MATLLACVVGLGGCVVFQNPPTATQNAVIGSVHVTFTVCAQTNSNSPPPGSCPGTGNSNQSTVDQPTQVFLGFRVPTGAGAPPSFSSTATGPGDAGPQLTFTLNPQYASELQRLDAAPSGEQWVGYTSQYVAYNHTSGDQDFTASIDFGLPTNADGAPYTGPFTWQAVVGGRYFGGSGTPAANAPVDCENSLSAPFGGQTVGWVCVDDPSPSTFNSDNSLPTRDAGITSSAAASGPSGTTASVPFTFGFVGTAIPAANFTLQATTTILGATATPDPGTVTPAGPGTTPVSVSVTIPAGTNPGPYPVTLTANLADGESRTGTGMLVVLPPPKCRVPGIVGRTINAARTLLTTANCRLGIVRTEHAAQRKGMIIAQIPRRGTLLAHGSAVVVTESLGPKPKPRRQITRRR